MNKPIKPENYGPYFTENKLWNKLRKVARKAGLKICYLALLLFHVLKSDKTPKSAKLKIIGALGYFILPTDLIPDAIAVLGFTDDLAALIWAYQETKSYVSPQVIAEAKEELHEWFGDFDDKELELL